MSFKVGDLIECVHPTPDLKFGSVYEVVRTHVDSIYVTIKLSDISDVTYYSHRFRLAKELELCTFDIDEENL